ncbi:MAG: O-succinylhomoserine sulfhydrylase [Nitrospirae bacterium]|nr:MAG: O-succinylhomoserine sulfhydrylase [Nitrospirota bacterium]
MEERPLRRATLAVRAGHHPTPFREHSEACFLTSSFTFESAAQQAALFAGEGEGFLYSRFTNPTVAAFEERYAALEGAEAGLATASGMAAIATVCLALLGRGDRVVCAREVFGSTHLFVERWLSRWGITSSFVPLADLAAWERALARPARLCLVETPSNPTLAMVDLAALCRLAHERGALVVVDNAFATPILQRPLEHGADLVVSSATKYLDGQGRVLGGVVAGSRELVRGEIFGFLRTAGPTLSAFNAWLLLKGLETLPVRMQAHCAGASRVAAWLAERQDLAAVTHPSLPDYPYREVAERQMEGPGGLVTFDVGGAERARRVVDRLQLFSRTANLGDTRSIVSHPASTTHARLTPEQRAAAGITEGLLRLSVGLEDPDDLIADLDRALAR